MAKNSFFNFKSLSICWKNIDILLVSLVYFHKKYNVVFEYIIYSSLVIERIVKSKNYSKVIFFSILFKDSNKLHKLLLIEFFILLTNKLILVVKLS